MMKASFPKTNIKGNSLLFAIFVIAAFSVLSMTACSDDDSFTDSPYARLEFSDDTIMFDTVFTTIGSSTKWLKVFNNNSEGLHLASVSLASGGESGFKINVDGQSGITFPNISIRANDSIFIFVEVNVDPHDEDNPILIEDSIRFMLESGVTQYLYLRAYGQDVIIMRAQNITQDTSLSPQRPYLIYDSLCVSKDAVLTLTAGTRLYFHNNASLMVHGSLVCNGTLEAPVMMRGDRLDRMFSYLPYDRLDKQWGGVHLLEDSHDNVFNFTDIHSGSYGIKAEPSDFESYKLTIANSVLHNVRGTALQLNYCAAYVANSQISNAGEYCVNMTGGYADFVHCTIAQFYHYSQYVAALNFTNFRNDTIYPLYRAHFYNCYITGRMDDEIYGTRIDAEKYPEANFDYLFDHCAIKTVLDPEDQSFISCIADTLEKASDNFKNIDTDNFIYDFRLDTMSVARNAANDDFIEYYPTDRNGIFRRKGYVDAGCYQFE